MTQPQPLRHGQVDGRDIYVYDGLADQEVIRQIKIALDRAPFVRNEIARPDTGDYRHWAHNMSLDAARQLPLHEATMRAIAPFRTDRDYRVYRTYTNYSSYGDMLFTHTDCLPGANEITALWFIATAWNVEWGGETLFFNQQQDAEFVVSPKPGRLVVFDGSITHCGRPPSRICHEARYTFAMKLEPVTPQP